MEPIFYIMAILGCADAEVACQQVRITEQRFVSADACMAESAGILLANSDLPYPVVMTQCRRADTRLAEANGRPRS